MPLRHSEIGEKEREKNEAIPPTSVSSSVFVVLEKTQQKTLLHHSAKEKKVGFYTHMYIYVHTVNV